eukprot:g9857.t1
MKTAEAELAEAQALQQRAAVTQRSASGAGLGRLEATLVQLHEELKEQHHEASMVARCDIAEKELDVKLEEEEQRLEALRHERCAREEMLEAHEVLERIAMELRREVEHAEARLARGPSRSNHKVMPEELAEVTGQEEALRSELEELQLEFQRQGQLAVRHEARECEANEVHQECEEIRKSLEALSAPQRAVEAAEKAFQALQKEREIITEALHRKQKRRTTTRLEENVSECSFPLSLGPSEPSQTQSDEQLAGTVPAEEVVSLALKALSSALDRSGLSLPSANVSAAGGRPSPAEDVVLSRVRTLSLCAVAYWREDLGKAAASLARFLEMQRRLYWRRPPWRGVNLGGWLLLEPGPSHELFQQFGARNSHCEWQLLHQMRNKLGPQRAAEVLEAHRSTFVTEEDFQQIKSYGFNAVRIPFGYWIVTGPSNGDLYVGPALDILDRALAWCKHLGLQVLLDLHGAPGGESGETPCGREMKDWRWERWRFEESLEALKIIAERYKGHPAVSGIAVCNEPSEKLGRSVTCNVQPRKVPADVLCQFYDQAIQAIRAAGMPPDEVSIVLPVYRTERLDEIWRLWNKVFDGFARHANVAFDLHLAAGPGDGVQRERRGGLPILCECSIGCAKFEEVRKSCARERDELWRSQLGRWSRELHVWRSRLRALRAESCQSAGEGCLHAEAKAEAVEAAIRRAPASLNEPVSPVSRKTAVSPASRQTAPVSSPVGKTRKSPVSVARKAPMGKMAKKGPEKVKEEGAIEAYQPLQWLQASPPYRMAGSRCWS